MPIGVQQYPGFFEHDSDPIGAGLKESIARRLMQAQARQTNALAEGQEQENPFVAAIKRAQAQHAQLENKWYEPNIQSEMGLRGAQANLANTTAQYMPTKLDIEKMNANSRRGELANSNSSALRQWVSTPEGQQMVARDQKLAESIYNAIQQSAGNYGYPESGGQKNPMNVAQRQTQQDYDQNPSKAETIKSIQRGAADAYEHTNLPADTKKRLYAGNRFKTIVPLIMKDFKEAQEYFSPQGYVQLQRDLKSPLFDQSRNPKLEAYKRFKQDIEQAVLFGANLEGVPADQISRGDYKKIFELNQFFTNPQGAENYLKNGINLALMADESNRSSLSELTGMSPKRDMANPETLTKDDLGRMSKEDKLALYKKMKDAQEKKSPSIADGKYTTDMVEDQGEGWETTPDQVIAEEKRKRSEARKRKQK